MHVKQEITKQTMRAFRMGLVESLFGTGRAKQIQKNKMAIMAAGGCIGELKTMLSYPSLFDSEDKINKRIELIEEERDKIHKETITMIDKFWAAVYEFDEECKCT